MSLAFYRKYRPRTFQSMLGQEVISDTLRSAARQDKLAHAYLFYGSRGTGKTTTARLIAKVANCLTRTTDSKFHGEGEPCNQCRMCKEIDQGLALDVVEIDAASNRGIEEIRALNDAVRLSPTSYAYKVFIIDEMHMLTREAFNALLKTIEEPPAHVIFVLATTEYDKVPATITSRAQRFHFHKLPLVVILQKLQQIVVTEALHIDADALELIAALAEGSLRDAESLLDQLAALGDHVDVLTVERIVGKVGYRAIVALAGHLIVRDLPKSLEYLASCYESGRNLSDLTKDLISYLRRVLALKFDAKLADVFVRELTNEELDALKKHSVIAEPTFVIGLLKSLIRAYSEMRYSPIAIAPLEVAVIENLSEAH